MREDLGCYENRTSDEIALDRRSTNIYSIQMKLQIDNLDGFGPRDYTSAIDASHPPQIIRKLNKPSELRVSLVADSPEFIVPAAKARITLGRTNGQDVFTGYLMQAPSFQYLGWGDRGPVYRYKLNRAER
jgi:hypothetical protein